MKRVYYAQAIYGLDDAVIVYMCEPFRDFARKY